MDSGAGPALQSPGARDDRECVPIEAILVSLLAAAVLVPAAARVAGRRTGRLGVGIAVVAFVALAGNAVRHAPRFAAVDQAVNRPVEVRSDGFVSSKACQSCHPDQHASWSGSYHSSMTRVASPESVIPKLDGLELELEGVTYRFERRGRRFWVELPDPDFFVDPDYSDEEAPAIPRVWRQLVMTTGSHHDQDYWFETPGARAVQRLPIDYRIGPRMWIPYRWSFLYPPEAPDANPRGEWNASCIECHSTHGSALFERGKGEGPRASAKTQVAELGIACESCHGAGEEHVRLNRDPRHRYRLHLSGGEDRSIVNPAHLTARRATDVCGQCHGNWVDREPEGSPRRRRYRPGDALSETRVYARKRYLDPADQSGNGAVLLREIEDIDAHMREIFWSDGMVRVSGREYHGIIESPCFQGGRMSCQTCHTLHQASSDPRLREDWADDQLAPLMRGDAACLQCHPGLAGDESGEAHTHHRADSRGSACQNCHMPHTAQGILKASRSHQISSPSVQETLETGRPNACNLCHLDRPLGWTATRLREWYGTPEPALERADREVAAGVRWLLSGDAGQRALAAWHAGWAPAQQASTADWMAAHLAPLLDDPYHAVRWIAFWSLRTLPGFGDFEYAYVAEPPAWSEAARLALREWSARGSTAGPRPAVLIARDGSLDAAAQARLLAARDDTPFKLGE